MDHIRLGRTELMVGRSGFGAIPIQRISVAEATALLRKAYANGVNFYDTAHGYTDSEEKIGLALGAVRDEIVLATKTSAKDRRTFWEHLELSLRRLRTDRIDIYQLHNPKVLPRPGDGSGLYECLLEARGQGKIRFIGMTNHRSAVAAQAAESGLYDTVQFPFSVLSSDADLAVVEAAKRQDVGFIAMKALAGGLLTDARAAFAYLRELNYPVPIWGIETESQLDEFIALEHDPPPMDDTMRATIARDRAELSLSFCRGCGYCLPCPVGIEINMAARLPFLMRRSIWQNFVTDEWRAKMERIDDCLNCGQCHSRCPYELDIPKLLKTQLVEYRAFIAALG